MSSSILPSTAQTSPSISVDDIRKRASGSASDALKSAAKPLPGQNLDKNAFLKLLTVQLKNQDPMDPIKNEAFVAQLAQFSSLEQLQNINTTLADGNKNGTTQGSATLTALSNNTAVSLIGKQVEISSNTVNLPASGQAYIPYSLDGDADRVTADISDQQGKRVRSLTLHPSGRQGRVVWDGKSDGGARVDPGTYSISLSAQAAGNPVNVSSASTYKVTGVRTRNGAEPLLIFDGGTIPLSSVSGIFTKG